MQQGNSASQRGEQLSALRLYAAALQLCPNLHTLHCNFSATAVKLVCSMHDSVERTALLDRAMWHAQMSACLGPPTLSVPFELMYVTR